MVIITTDKNKNFLNVVLSSKIFVGIGLISYSLYLWHFPIFAFSRITEFTQGEILRKVLVILVIFLLAVFSYWFVKNHFVVIKLNLRK